MRKRQSKNPGKTLVLRKEVLPRKILAGFLTYGNNIKAFSTDSRATTQDQSMATQNFDVFLPITAARTAPESSTTTAAECTGFPFFNDFQTCENS